MKALDRLWISNVLNMGTDLSTDNVQATRRLMPVIRVNNYLY